MTRQSQARLITIILLAMAMVIVTGRRSGWQLPAWKIGTLLRREPKAGPRPQDAVYAMLDAARLGDVKAYLATYTGQISASLQRTVIETGVPGFARYLKESNAAIKGIAIAEPQALNDGEVKLRVEYVYQDRNEAQFMYLEKTETGWKIARVDGIERVKTLVPYGTLVQ